jgi:hypothetical protein
MGMMENYRKDPFLKKERNKKNKRIKSIGIYFTVIVFTVITNIPIFLYVTWRLTTDVTNYLSANISFLYVKKPIIFFEGLFKLLAIDFMLNLFLLLVIEFVVVCLFRKRLNKFFKIDNLFTIKKILLLAIAILVVQFIFSCWLCYI